MKGAIETPRTDEFINSCVDYEKWHSYRDRLHEFARSLERENTALKEEVALSYGTLESRERNIEMLRAENERLRKQFSMLLDDKQHPAHLADMKAWFKSMRGAKK